MSKSIYNTKWPQFAVSKIGFTLEGLEYDNCIIIYVLTK